MDYAQWQVLLVEDEHDSVQVVSEILAYHGIEFEVARNGQECLQMLDHLDPTLVIMDLAMPELDGWQTLVAMRANPDTAHIPVVAITAFAAVNVAHDAMKAGFDGYYSQPLNPMAFVQEITRIVA